MKHLLTLLLTLCCTLPAHAEDTAIAALFAKAGVAGTLVIESTADDRRFVHDDARAQKPFTPASTFKILNTLIAVEHGAITAEATIPWDGVEREMADWNRDQTLASAFRVSCVWCYQWLARRVGADAYPARLREAGYTAACANPSTSRSSGSTVRSPSAPRSSRLPAPPRRAQPALWRQHLRHAAQRHARRGNAGLPPVRQDRLGCAQHAAHRLVRRLRRNP